MDMSNVRIHLSFLLRIVTALLTDGTTVAIDWHFAVYEEALNSRLLGEVRRPGASFHSPLFQLIFLSLGGEENSKVDERVPSVPLSSCLDKFTEVETLSDVVCPKCKDDKQLKQRIQIWRLPPVLVVQMKRFQFTRQARRKLNTKVDFPLVDLDLQPYMASGAPNMDMYDLYGTVHHVGALGGGHYVTALLDSSSGTKGVWLCFNDEQVSEVSEADIQSASAYLLFYVRRDIKDMSYRDIFEEFKKSFATINPQQAGALSDLFVDTSDHSSGKTGGQLPKRLSEAELEDLIKSGRSQRVGSSKRKEEKGCRIG